MWDFGLQLEEDTAEYTGDFAGIIKQAPAAYRLLTQLLEDPDVPSEKRTGLLAAVA